MRKGDDRERGTSSVWPTASHLPQRGKAFGETVLTAFEAAEIIRVAFGKEGWRWKVRSRYTAAQIVAALWVAQNDSGKERLRDLIGWAWRLK